MALEKAESREASVPGFKFEFQWDPRLFTNSEQFRDYIRRSLNCQELGLDLQSIRVKYHHRDENLDDQVHGFGGRAGLRGVLDSPDNSDFVLDVRLHPFDTEDPMFSLQTCLVEPVCPVYGKRLVSHAYVRTHPTCITWRIEETDWFLS